MIYHPEKVKQLKLVTGEEVICEIVEEDDDTIIVRNTLNINFITLENGERMWTFKYYMCYQDDPERFILIKTDKVVAVANPMKMLVRQYEAALDEMMEVEGHEKPEYLEGWGDEELSADSDQSNEIDFPTTLH